MYKIDKYFKSIPNNCLIVFKNSFHILRIKKITLYFNIGNPNIFSEFADKRQRRKFNFLDWLKLYKKTENKQSFNQIKFQALNFTRDFEGSAKARDILAKTKNEKELLKLIKTLSKTF